MFDEPWWRDWIAWLTVLAVAVGAASSLGSTVGEPWLTRVAWTFAAAAVQTFLFGAIPAWVRAEIRYRRAVKG